MATVAPMPPSAKAPEREGKLTSFTAEADCFDHKHASSSSTMSNNPKNGASNSASHQKSLKENSRNHLNGDVSKQIPGSELGSRLHHQNFQVFKDNFVAGCHQRKISSSSQSSPGTPMLTESTLSLAEYFDSDDIASPPPPYSNSHDSSPRRNERNEDEWFSGDGDLLEKGPEETNSVSTTPPLSLYMGKHCVPQTIPESSNASSFESGRNTPNSYSGSQVTSRGGEEEQVGSMNSNNSSFARPGSITRPILYSAIGSLENANATSLGSLNKRFLASGKEFSQIGAMQLIPPANKLKISRTSVPIGSSKVDKSDTVATTNAGSRTTPTTSNQRKSTMAETEAVKPKLDKGKEATSNKERSKLDSTVSEHAGKNAVSASQKPSNLRMSSTKTKGSNHKKVSINNDSLPKKNPVEMFRPSCDAYTPRIEKKRIKYRAAETRTPVQKMASPMGTLQRPNFRDALRRVAMIIHQHIVKIERRFESADVKHGDQGLFQASMRDLFEESNYCTPTYKCTMVRIPMARPGIVYGLRKIKTTPTIPSEEEIYEFAHQLFKSVQLSSECSIVCLIYVERLMEIAKVPLLACTWRPIFMCGLLLASKVWQDLSSWNIEFANVYPQFSLDAINRLELNFLRNVKWDLYISSSLYAKYYFALRSLVEKVDFRQRYNRMVGGVDSVAQSEALKIQKRTEQVKEEALLQLSRSM